MGGWVEAFKQPASLRRLVSSVTASQPRMRIRASRSPSNWLSSPNVGTSTFSGAAPAVALRFTFPTAAASAFMASWRRLPRAARSSREGLRYGRISRRPTRPWQTRAAARWKSDAGVTTEDTDPGSTSSPETDAASGLLKNWSLNPRMCGRKARLNRAITGKNATFPRSFSKASRTRLRMRLGSRSKYPMRESMLLIEDSTSTAVMLPISTIALA
mmetsp:Transcript_10903/g.31268  ORF Transcript_10903/g.31268 Transcript_10903/m.31268 type:complete len:215 (-) Transcript_10903:553-1197(-)